MSNVLQAFINIVESNTMSVDNITTGNNRANNMGEGLEEYIQKAFSDALNSTDEQPSLETLASIFSFQGNKNNPPDLILRNSDAIEIKKIQYKNSGIALNSSYPKAKIYADSPMITDDCRTCEEWAEKDMLYTVGYTEETSLKSLWLVYGDCFCADKEIYERIKNTISTGVSAIPDIDFTQTNELAKVKKVDPLGITDLRIRGMWHIDNPNKIFSYLYNYDESATFQLMLLLKADKYMELPEEDREIIENHERAIHISDVKIKNPNNPAQLINAKLITFKEQS